MTNDNDAPSAEDVSIPSSVDGEKAFFDRLHVCSSCGLATVEDVEKCRVCLLEDLEELVEEWEDGEYARKHDYYAQIGLRIASDDLKDLIKEHEE